MAAGRAPLWFLVAAPGVVVITIGLWNLLPASDATETRASAPPQSAAPVSPQVVVTPTEDTAGSGCVAPAYDEAADYAPNRGWLATDPLPADAITGRVVDSDGRPIAFIAQLRFWTPDSAWQTWTERDGPFGLRGPEPGLACDVDVILPQNEFPGRRNARFHVGTLRAGDRGVVLRLPIARSVIAAGTLVDESGRALARWRVLARGKAPDATTPATLAEATTESDGRFVLTAWTLPDFALEIRTPGGGLRAIARRETLAGSADVRLIAGRPMVSGRVTTGDGADPAGAIVGLRDVQTGASRSATAATGGEFVFEDVGDRTEYELTAELDGHVRPRHQHVTSDSPDVRIHLTGLGQFVEGLATDARDRPLRFAWLRFIATDRSCGFQTMTDVDGRFFSAAAWPTDYDAFLLAPGPDQRLVPGPNLGRARGGDRRLSLRVPR